MLHGTYHGAPSGTSVEDVAAAALSDAVSGDVGTMGDKVVGCNVLGPGGMTRSDPRGHKDPPEDKDLDGEARKRRASDREQLDDASDVYVSVRSFCVLCLDTSRFVSWCSKSCIIKFSNVSWADISSKT